VKAARDKKAVPFDGKLVAHSYLQDVELPTYLPRGGTEIEAPAHVQAHLQPALLDATEAMLLLRSGIGRNLTSDEYTFFTARYSEGVPEDQINALIAQFSAPAAEPVRAVGGLRAV